MEFFSLHDDSLYEDISAQFGTSDVTTLLEMLFYASPYMYKLKKEDLYHQIVKYKNVLNEDLYNLFTKPSEHTFTQFTNIILQMKSLNTHMMGNFFGHFMLLLIYRFVKVKVNTFENLDEILKEYNMPKTPKFTNSTQDLEDKLQAANEAILVLNAQLTTLQTQNQLLNSRLLNKGSVSKSTTEMLLDNTHKFNYHNENALPINLINDWDSEVSLATKIKLNYNPHATKVRDQIKTAALKNVLNQTSIKLKDCYVEHETNKIVYIMRDQVKPKEKISFTKKNKNTINKCYYNY